MKLLPLLATVFLSAVSLQAVVPVPSEVTPERVAGASPRNVVLILSDDHRYDAMSFINHQFAQTPTWTRWRATAST